MKNLVKVFKALSDETRLNILLLVYKRNICQKGISKFLGISDSAVSQHIKVLKDAGIITGKKEGYYVLYEINRDAFLECTNFMHSIGKESGYELLDYEKINDNNINCSINCKSIKMCCKRREK